MFRKFVGVHGVAKPRMVGVHHDKMKCVRMCPLNDPQFINRSNAKPGVHLRVFDIVEKELAKG
jgi:hypothetical protein